MNKKVIIIVCPKCKGTTKITETIGAGPLKEKITSTCPICKGSGLVERTILIEDKSYFPYE